MKYQQLLNVVLANQIESNLAAISNTIEKELNEMQNDGSTG